MTLGYPPDDRQAETRPAGLPGRRPVPAPEPVKHPSLILYTDIYKTITV